MNFFYVFGAFLLIAYVIQSIFSIYQIKHFNKIYVSMRRQGKVAIGKKVGRIQSGTLVMLAVDEDGTILDSKYMQGFSVFSKFKELPSFIGEDIHYLDKYNPKVREKNKPLQKALSNAQEVYLKVEAGTFDEQGNNSLTVFNVSTKFNMLKNQFKMKFQKKGV